MGAAASLSCPDSGHSVSLVVSTYEKPRELELALAAVAALDRRGIELELIVADDGSGEATAAVVREFAARAEFDVKHVRHEDRGFRLARIRNRAVLESTGEVLVFVDGDSLVERDLLRGHARRCAPGRAVSGWRAQLDAGETDGLRASGKVRTAIDAAVARDRRRRRLAVWKNALYRATRLKQRPKLIGGNCSIHRDDLERVNGFDERFEGWGLEDDDIARRLRRAGVRVVDGAIQCLVVHLFHLTHPSHRPTIHHTRNFEYFHRPGFLTRCRHGLRPRELADVGFVIEGQPPAALAGLPERLGAPAARPEARLVFARTGEARSEEYILEMPALESIEDALRFLEIAI